MFQLLYCFSKDLLEQNIVPLQRLTYNKSDMYINCYNIYVTVKNDWFFPQESFATLFQQN